MVAPLTCLSSLSSPCFCSISPMEPSFSPLFFLFLTFSILSLSLLFFSLLKRFKRAEEEEEEDPQSLTSLSTLKLTLSKISEKTQNAYSTPLPQSILLEQLNSNLPKWGALFSPVRVCDDSVESGSNSGDSGGENEERKAKKKKKKRAKKKNNNSSSNSVDLQLENGGEERELGLKNKEELVCLYPFTSSSSATQRKIKQQYDQLVKSHESKGLTLAQVGHFVNCLVDARNELQHKSECIKRKFTITKALLLKADRSSFDRLRQQIYKLELEQKRLEEDAFVYNWLQHQLKLSPAYKKIVIIACYCDNFMSCNFLCVHCINLTPDCLRRKFQGLVWHNKMVEIGACMELKAKSGDLTENPDTESDISFEEFLAQEKKDTFWQKHGKPKLC